MTSGWLTVPIFFIFQNNTLLIKTEKPTYRKVINIAVSFYFMWISSVSINWIRMSFWDGIYLSTLKGINFITCWPEKAENQYFLKLIKEYAKYTVYIS